MRNFRLLVAVVAVVVVADAGRAGEARIGAGIGNFTLHDHLGAQHSLTDWKERRLVVVVFLGVDCPLAKLYGSRLSELAGQYEPKGVQFVGINSNRQDTLREIAHYARVHKINFPLLKDPDQRIADLFGATRTPMAFILDEQRDVRYQGRIDDQYGVGYARAGATTSDLATALDELLASTAVSTPVTEAVGCIISRVRPKAPTGDITYCNQIARVVRQHCVSCHRPGRIAPFSLTSYEDVAAWAETMCEVMEEGRMPPWHANPEYGEFSNDAHMPVADKELFRQWFENGMPEGDPSQLPEPARYSDGWQIPEPDVVLRMPAPFTVPAKGIVPYQYFFIDRKFDDDVWVRGAEIRPGNHSVVHHAFLFFLPPGQEEIRAEDPLFNAIAGFAPGMPAELWPEGYARFVPAGSKLVFQVHYTPNGSEQVDQTEAGILFADAKSQNTEVKFAIAVNTDFRIPPGAANHHVPAGYDFKQDTMLHALIPHMHYRGKSFRFTAEYPDGSKEILLDVPRYDFNWQNAYVLQEPKRMPKGTVIMCAGYFDNSSDNLANPDPTQEVRWGDQTWDEMMLGSLVISLPDSIGRGEYPKVELVGEGDFDVAFRYRPQDDFGDVSAVYLAGSFNDWKETGHRMDGPDEHGYFRTSVRLKPGLYEYKFVINGQHWTHDPENPDQNGPFTNSVLRVRQRDDPSIAPTDESGE